MPLNRNQDFMFEDTTTLTTNAKSLKGALNEVNASLASKVSYPVLSWEYVNGVSVVTNVALPYGNVMRYGAKGDGVTNDSPSFQTTFDLCSVNGQEIIIPIGTFKINTSITLYDCFNLTTKRSYRIRGVNTEFSAYSTLSPKCIISPNCNLFESGTPSNIADISLDMTGVYVQYPYNVSFQYVMFNNIKLRGSFFARNRIDSAYIWLKGSLEETTTVENNIFYHIKKNFIKECDYSTSSAYHACSDSIVRNNYINGDGTQNCIMINTYFYDYDMKMEDNFIDYFAYLFQGLNGTLDCYLGLFKNNIINHCFRVSNGNVKYGIFTGNNIEYCKYADCSSIFTNPLPEMTSSTHWGGFIYDENNPYTIYQLALYDNNLLDSDTILYFVSTNSFRKYVQGFLYEKGSINGNITFQQMNDTTAFSTTKIQTLDYTTLATYNDVKQIVNGNTILNGYEGQHVWMAGILYTAHLVNSVPVWVETNGALAGNKGVNVAVSASSTTLAITLGKTETDTNYGIQVTPYWNTTYWITNKTTTGFTINFGTAPASASTLDWTTRR